MSSLEFREIGKAYDFEVEDNLEGFLISKGIEFPELFLNPYQLKEETHPFNFSNMQEAVGVYNIAIKSGRKIAILVDDDADGYSSSSAMMKYIYETEGIIVDLIFHNDKAHGLTNSVMEQILKSDYQLIIIPDSSSNDVEQQRELLSQGIELIILDHHEMDNQKALEELAKEFPYSFAIVNNKLDTNEDINLQFVGAGIVYKFCQALDFTNGNYKSDELLDLVAMGQIGDASDVADYEIRNLVRRGLDNITSPLLHEVFQDKIENKETITSTNLSFSIIPMANATSRIGSKDDKEMLVKALAGVYDKDELVMVKRKRKSKITGKMEQVELQWSHYTLALDELTKLKSKQDRTITKVIKKIDGNIFKSSVTIVEAEEGDIEHRSLTGLLANRIASQNETPTLVLVCNDDDTYSGSARGFEKSMDDFRQWCNDSGYFEMAQGHANAFGVSIESSKLELLKEELQKKNDGKSQIVYDVDKIYEDTSNIALVTTINDHEELFGGSLQKPVYGYKNLVVGRNSISQRGSVVSIYHSGLEFIAYKQEAGIVDDFMISLGFEQFVTVDLVGSPSKNDFTGQIRHQIVLKDYAMRAGGREVKRSVELDKGKNTWLDASGELSF